MVRNNFFPLLSVLKELLFKLILYIVSKLFLRICLNTNNFTFRIKFAVKWYCKLCLLCLNCVLYISCAIFFFHPSIIRTVLRPNKTKYLVLYFLKKFHNKIWFFYHWNFSRLFIILNGFTKTPVRNPSIIFETSNYFWNTLSLLY